jgi:hypothetical protein
MVELAITVLLLSIVTFVLFNFLDNTTKVTARTNEDLAAENDAQLALRTMTEDIRGTAAGSSTSGIASCASASACGSTLTFFVSRPSVTQTACGNGIAAPYSTITYSLVGTTLQETRTETKADCATTTTRFSNRQIIKNIVAGTAVFSYLDANGNLINLNLSGNDSNGSPQGRDLLPSPRAVSAVKISLKVQYRGGSTPLTITSVASLRNARSTS